MVLWFLVWVNLESVTKIGVLLRTRHSKVVPVTENLFRAEKVVWVTAHWTRSWVPNIRNQSLDVVLCTWDW